MISERVAEEIWSMFDDWSACEYRINSEWGVGPDDDPGNEIEQRRQRLIRMIGVRASDRCGVFVPCLPGLTNPFYCARSKPCGLHPEDES